MANDDGAVFETHDVFLSFMGDDTRHGFTGHLYNALHKEGVQTFMDDQGLRVGVEELEPALLKTIEESKISIVVLSPNYAASSWCLNELNKIVQCHKKNNQIIIPIFYKVEPSDVAEQKNSYAKAMAIQETLYRAKPKKLRKWRSSLKKVPKSKGYHLRERIDYEYKVVEEIVREVSIKVFSRSLDINEHIVGLGYQVEEMKSLLEIESKDTTCFLGIHGTGGIGKTTLAKALFNSICDQFEGACFLSRVRETSDQFEGEKLMLKMLLSDMLKGREIQFASVSEGTKTMKRMLRRKRVLLVLDDVDDIKQLELLAGDWFCLGSKIIITTKNMRLLDDHKVVIKKHEMKVLNGRDSMELFCRNAFRRSHIPDPNFEELSNRAIDYAKGLPLALKVLGSHLFTTKRLDVWKSALDKYEKSPHKDIQSILRISYDSLDSNERDIFLDIACFFKGKRLEYVKPILDACGFYPGEGIGVLVDKSLITVENSCLMMHDLIQYMGREIVKEENPKEVGQHSRLWFHEDVLEVLTENKGSNKIEGIMLDPPQRKEIEWAHSAFEKMKELRILIVRNTSFSSAPSFLSNKLRLLDWKDYPSQSFPSGFCPKKIVAFNLRGSSLIQPFQAFKHLTCINVSDCHSVTQIPNMSGAESLRELRFDRCEKLDTVDESVGFLPKLVYLNASECSQLRSFVPKIYLPSLEHLSFSSCRRLQNFPEIVEEMYKPLKIYLINTSITKLPLSIGNLTGLEYVQMANCDRLQYLPSGLFMLPDLVTLKVGGCSQLNPDSFRRFEESNNSLRTLHYGNVGLLDEDLDMIIHKFPMLEDLNLSGNHLVSFPARISDSVCLTALDVSACVKLQKIPKLPPTVQKVNARRCNSLNAETLAMLWFQVREEMKRFEVIMPRSKIPNWFNHRYKLGVPVFKFSGKFPVVAVALVLKAKGVPRVEGHYVTVLLIIDGEPVHCKNDTFYVDSNHVVLFDLRVMLSDKEWEGIDARLNNNDLKTVHVALDPRDFTLKSWGFYVYKKEKNMADNVLSFDANSERISDAKLKKFFNDLRSTSDDIELARFISLPQMFDRHVMMQKEFKDSDPSIQSDLAPAIKETNRYVSLTEARGSGFILQEEDDKEMQQLMEEGRVMHDKLREEMKKLMRERRIRRRKRKRGRRN